MDKFIVSARKYRPQVFETVIGQSHITTTLKNAIRHQQLAHAFLFCGPRGVGKTTCARILAKTINCEHISPEGEACDACSSCISFNEGGSLNYFELDGASNNSVDNIRDLVDQVRFVPQSGKYKVYVIDEVHMLTSSAFNAFLKTLEEPPPYAIFILATTEKHKILPTILSRCQIFDFRRISTQDTVQHLEHICARENIQAEHAALQVIAQKSEGCLRDALSILDKIVSFTNGALTYTHTLEHLNILDADYFFKFLDCMQQQDLSGALLLFDDVNRKGFEGDMLLNGLAEFIRNLLVCKDERSAGLLDVVESFKEKYLSVAQVTDPSLLISALNVLNEAELNYKAARNKRLHLELTLIKLCYLKQALDLTHAPAIPAKKKVEGRSLAFRTALIQSYAPQQTQPAPLNNEEAKLIIVLPNPKSERTPGQKPVKQTLPETGTTAAPSLGKLTALNKIREQYIESGKTNGTVNRPIQIDDLKKLWQDFVSLLKEEKNPAAQPFERALLRIKDDNSFEAVSSNNVEKQFIEQSRIRLFQFLQDKLQNRLLQFNVLIEDNGEERPQVAIPLSSSQQYQKMISLYPHVKELKERLNLSLDY